MLVDNDALHIQFCVHSLLRLQMKIYTNINVCKGVNFEDSSFGGWEWLLSVVEENPVTVSLLLDLLKLKSMS